MNKDRKPEVSVIVPCLNESKYIETFLGNLIDQLNRHKEMRVEVVIADGMSEDGTRKRIQQIADHDSRIRLIDNPGRIQAAGLNLAIKQARGDIIVRMDVHSIYADDYVQKCVDTLKSTGADNVGGAVRPVGHGYLQEAIALATDSGFSMGGALFHDQDYEGFVDTVFLGCWLRKTLEEVGMFDEQMVRTEDDELNLRIRQRGGKIWQSRNIKSWYYPRSSLQSLFSQLYQYGYSKVGVIRKHKTPPSLRSLVPGLFVAALILMLGLSLLHNIFLWGFVVLAAIYALAVLMTSIMVCAQRSHLKYLPVMPIVFSMFHFGYGIGFLRGIVDSVLFGRKKWS